MDRRTCLAALAAAWAPLGAALPARAQPMSATPPQARRVVVLGGVVTEIVYALQAGDRVVGVDSSSLYPPEAARLPKVGYYRGFSVEGVASLQPDLVIASDQAGPPRALEQLRGLGAPVVVLPSEPTLTALEQRIVGAAAALGRSEQGQALAERVHAEVAAIEPVRPPPRALLLSAHSGKLQAAGTGTAADALLRLAGGHNVFAESGYKPIAGEAAASLLPDVLVTTATSVGAVGSVEAFVAQPGLSTTPAARARRVVVMDDLLLLGFGPRLGQALRQLQAGLRPR